MTVMVAGWLMAGLIAVAGCGSNPVGTTVGVVAPQSATTVSAAAPVDILPTTNTTIPPSMGVMTTSQVFAENSDRAVDLATQLGRAVVAYLDQKDDLASVQDLVTDSAQAGLAQMLSLLGGPTGCKVWSCGGSGPYTTIDVQLVFADGRSRQPDFNVTVSFDSNTPVIAAIAPSTHVDPDPMIESASTTAGNPVADSSLPVMGASSSHRIEYMNHDYAYYTSEAVVLGEVVDVLPLRRNPLAAKGTGPSTPEPVIYKGYVLKVEKAWGSATMPTHITVFTVGSGEVELDGVAYRVKDDLPLDVLPGDRLLVPLMKLPYYGTPSLAPDEYWVQDNWAVFVVSDDADCTRATGAWVDPESRSEFPLATLEKAVAESGKVPSRIE